MVTPQQGETMDTIVTYAFGAAVTVIVVVALWRAVKSIITDGED